MQSKPISPVNETFQTHARCHLPCIQSDRVGAPPEVESEHRTKRLLGSTNLRGLLLGRGLAGLRWGLLLGLVCSMQLAWATTWTGKVSHVSDGDTLWVRPQRTGAPRAVRIDGIDAPELCQAHGERARAALAARVLGQQVQVRVRGTDDYGRALARISLQGQDIGAWLVAHGHAWSYRHRGHAGPYAAEEKQARQRRLGLFAASRPENPRDFRKRHGPCH